MGVACAGAFGILALIAHVTAISSIAPSLMMSVLVAMDFDYSLFLLSRFREEAQGGVEVRSQ